MFIADAAGKVQRRPGPGMGLELEPSALRGARVRRVAEAARQSDSLLDVIPTDEISRSVDREAVIEPGGLRAELVVPKMIGLEVARLLCCQSETGQIARASDRGG